MAHWTRLRCRSPASTFSGRERARASAELIRSRRWKRRKRGDLSLFLFSITNEGIVFFFLPNCHDCPGIEEEKKNHHLDSYMYYSIDKKLYTCRPPEKKRKVFSPFGLLCARPLPFVRSSGTAHSFPLSHCAPRVYFNHASIEKEKPLVVQLSGN